ncbi:MAG: GTP cyclohydrolase II, partial [Promethearchaeota archaeon CR_4]
MLSTIEDAIGDLRAGRCVIVVDDENRENEGDLLALADRITPSTVNFMVTYGRGLLCVPLAPERAEELGLEQMTRKNTESQGTAFTVSVDCTKCSTGISADDRASTVRYLASPSKGLKDFRQPGHIFPLTARPRGVFERAGHTEATVDLARLCGAY